jgi:outer membrane lipoprotein SlyB
MKKTFSAIMVSAVIMTGCASQSGWSPTVDPYGDPNAANIDRDKVECRQLAKNAAGSTGGEVGKGAVVGGAIGAAAGAAIGAAVGAPGTGAAIGAATGGIGGGARQGFGSEGDYKQAFINCMRNRGHNVVN